MCLWSLLSVSVSTTAFSLSVSVRTQKPSEIRNLICCILFSRVWWDGKKTDRRQNVSRCGDGERGTSPPPSGPPLPPPPVAQHKTGRTKYKGSSSCCHHGLAALLQDRQGGVVGVEGMHYFVPPLHIYLTYFGMHWLGSACCLWETWTINGENRTESEIHSQYKVHYVITHYFRISAMTHGSTSCSHFHHDT